MKKPKVAAELSIYCDKVPITPLGPGPALLHHQIVILPVTSTHLMMENPPKIKPIVKPTVDPIRAPIYTL